MIPMVDLQSQYAEIQEEIETGIKSVLENCHFIMGPNVKGFEQEAAEYLGSKHAIGVASGTDALHLALAAAGIEQGDEVITTAFTFIATAEAIRHVGASPVFVDIDPQTFNIDPLLIEQAITPKTTAVLPVHIFGQPADTKQIKAICDKHGLKLIEDCAQSFGASVNNTKTGSIGDCAGFSFFPSKNLGAFGDGGLITTHSDNIAEKARMLRNHGSKKRYYHELVGYNSRLDEIQAMILRVKLKRIDQYNQGRRRAAELYSQLLESLPLQSPHEDGIGLHVYHQYTLLTDRRDEIIQALQQQDIASAVYYPVPLHKQNVFTQQQAQAKLPITENISERCLSLPIFPELSEADIMHITNTIKGVFSA